MPYRIAIRHKGDPEGTTFPQEYPTFLDAWTDARWKVEELIDANAPVEVRFSHVKGK
jgi:hypothetical protein